MPLIRTMVQDPELDDYRDAYLRSQARVEELAKERDGLREELVKLSVEHAQLRDTLRRVEIKVEEWEELDRDWDRLLRHEAAVVKEARRFIRRVESGGTWERVIRAYARLRDAVGS